MIVIYEDPLTLEYKKRFENQLVGRLLPWRSISLLTPNMPVCFPRGNRRNKYAENSAVTTSTFLGPKAETIFAKTSRLRAIRLSNSRFSVTCHLLCPKQLRGPGAQSHPDQTASHAARSRHR